MPYSIIQPPFTLKFTEMTKKELKDYYSWFQNILPLRLEKLITSVKETRSFESWHADFSPESLYLLGDWLASKIETRLRSKDEIKDIKKSSLFPIDIPTEELTNETFSIAMDVGMYLGEVFLKNHPTLSWDQPFGNKKFVDYGQPVITGLGSIPFNPVRMIVTLSYSLVSGVENGKSLRELYDIWVKRIEPGNTGLTQ